MKARNALNIAWFAVADELHDRSFFVLLGVCVLMVIGIRGCYRSDLVFNGERLDGLAVAWHASIAAYHAVVIFGLFAAMIFSNRAFRRDRRNGFSSMVLSHPVSRLDYCAGKVLGIWSLAFAFMFILHAVVFIMTLTISGGRLPMLPVASLVCGLGILFAVVLFCFLSTVFPEFVSLCAGAACIGISYVSDSLFAVMQSSIARTIASASGTSSPPAASWWRIAWPKIAALQYYGSALIREKEFAFMGPLHPALNVALYTAILFALLAWRIRREEY
jgi:ABC-type transport system involved in multi-copper enzyme maturation permease subunit